MDVDVESMMIFYSTGSSSDSSSEDEIILAGDSNQIERRPRVHNFIESVVYRYNDHDFKENFRLSRNTFEYLLFLLRPHLEGQLPLGYGKKPISPKKQLYIALYGLGTSDAYRSIVTKFDVGKATAWRAVHRVVKALYHFRNYFICWPKEHEIMEIAHRIRCS